MYRAFEGVDSRGPRDVSRAYREQGGMYSQQEPIPFYFLKDVERRYKNHRDHKESDGGYELERVHTV